MTNADEPGDKMNSLHTNGDTIGDTMNSLHRNELGDTINI